MKFFCITCDSEWILERLLSTQMLDLYLLSLVPYIEVKLFESVGMFKWKPLLGIFSCS